MNKILMTAAESALGLSSYQTPETSVMEVSAEGLLCISGQIETWEEDQIKW